MSSITAEEVAQELADSIRQIVDAWGEGDLADAVNRAREYIDTLPVDEASSASRQFYIDTGRYMLDFSKPAPPQLIVGVLEQDLRDLVGGELGSLFVACPHKGCNGTSIYEVDRSERWNEAEPEVAIDGASGEPDAFLRIYQRDGDYETVDWICQTCNQSVALPDGVETEWS
jgi:hypothetical protein